MCGTIWFIDLCLINWFIMCWTIYFWLINLFPYLCYCVSISLASVNLVLLRLHEYLCKIKTYKNHIDKSKLHNITKTFPVFSHYYICVLVKEVKKKVHTCNVHANESHINNSLFKNLHTFSVKLTFFCTFYTSFCR